MNCPQVAHTIFTTDIPRDMKYMSQGVSNEKKCRSYLKFCLYMHINYN